MAIDIQNNFNPSPLPPSKHMLCILFLSFSSISDGRNYYQDVESLDFYLEVILNGVERGVHSFTVRDSDIYASLSTICEIGLRKCTEREYSDFSKINLTSIPDVKTTYMESVQKIIFHASPDSVMLIKHVIDDTALVKKNADNGSRGIVINYQITSEGDISQQRASYSTEQRFLLDDSFLVNGFMGDKDKNVRLDTYFTKNFIDNGYTLQLGDSISSGGQSEYNLRYTGLKVFSNQDADSYIAMPLEIEGVATSKSNLKFIIDGIEYYNKLVPAGPFVLLAKPKKYGFSEGKLILTDSDGNESVSTHPVYVSPGLLKDGYSEWELSTGFTRENYGVDSFFYEKNPFISGTYKVGLNKKTTTDTLLRYENNRLAISSGANFKPNEFIGIFSVGAAHDFLQGALNSHKNWALYDWRNSFFGFGISFEEGVENEINRIASSNLIDRYQAWHKYINIRQGGVNSYFKYDEKRSARGESKASEVGFSIGISDKITLNAFFKNTITQQKDNSWGILFSFFDSTSSYSIDMDLIGDSGKTYQKVSGRKNISIDDLYLSAAFRNDRDLNVAMIDTEYSMNNGRIFAGIDSQSKSYFGGDGSLIFFEDRWFFSKIIQDSFALISMGGIPGVPIKLDNRHVGYSDESGYFIISDLRSYQENNISFDPLYIPPEYTVQNSLVVKIPYEKSGSFIDMPITKDFFVTVALRDVNGKELPAGTQVYVNDSTYILGFGGELYLNTSSHNFRIVAKVLMKGDDGVDLFKVCQADVLHQLGNVNNANYLEVICYPVE